MSRNVSRIDKFLRITGFSLYLSFIIFFFFLFFRGPAFSLTLFAVSTIYFMILFLLLSATGHVHFNVIINRSRLKKSLYDSVYPLARFRLFGALSFIILAFLVVMAAIYFYYAMPVHGASLIVIAALSYFYFHLHKIGVHVMGEGIAFDYGQLVVLLQWDEIKRIKIKGNHAVAELKEKSIKRRFYIKEPGLFRKAARKFIPL